MCVCVCVCVCVYIVYMLNLLQLKLHFLKKVVSTILPSEMHVMSIFRLGSLDMSNSSENGFAPFA